MEFPAGSASSKIAGKEYREVPHVLAVDDNRVDRKIIETLLRNSACEIPTAENGMRALEYLGLGDDGPNSTTMGNCVGFSVPCHVAGIQGELDHYRQLNAWNDWLLATEKDQGGSLSALPMIFTMMGARKCECLEEGAQMFELKPLKQADVKKLRCHLMNCRS